MERVRLIHIEEVVERSGVSRRTLRVYRKAGLVAPLQDEFYEEEAIETLARIGRLREELGVNLAGVQVILEMRRKIETLQESIREVVQFVHDHFGDELDQHAQRAGGPVIPRPLARPPRTGA